MQHGLLQSLRMIFYFRSALGAPCMFSTLRPMREWRTFPSMSIFRRSSFSVDICFARWPTWRIPPVPTLASTHDQAPPLRKIFSTE